MFVIPFDKIAPGATVRYTQLECELFLSVRDVIMHMSCIPGKRATEVWINLPDHQKKELAGDLHEFKFPGQGQHKMPVITVAGAMKLMMILPGKRAKAMRLEAADILTRYVNGHESLINEIHQNKKIGPIAACSKLLDKAEGGISSRQEMPQASYVYGTRSDAFPDLIKIGRSSDVAARLSSLNTGCAPAPHYIVAVAPTFNAPRDEALAHAFFSSARKEGEFFEVGVREVQLFFADHIMIQYQVELAEFISRAQGDV